METAKITITPQHNDKIELEVTNGYEIKVENGKCYVVKNKPQYPNDYEECCEVLSILDNRGFGFINLSECENILMSRFIQLKRCRDAYWKLAGTEMGLDKPWKPEWASGKPFYCISVNGNIIDKGKWYTDNKILAFPTKEMRDAFYENFRELIEQCKELL